MMDTESGVDGGDYYRRRLTVTAYGQWLVWLSSEKSQAVEDEERAVRCRLFGSRLTAMSRLAALVSASRRNSYHLRLADAIHTLVLLKKGLQRWRYYRALAESVDSWALQRWAQQRSLFRALCRLHDALRRRKFSRLLSPGRLQLAKVAVECWAEFTSHSLRSRGQQRRADVCWRRLALKRAVGRLRRREQHACQAWAAAQTGRRLYLRQAVVRAFRGYWSNVLKGREARGMLQSAARSARVSSTRTAFHHLHAYALRRVGRKRDVKGDVVWVQMAAVGQRRFIVALLRRMRRRLLRSPLVSRVSAHQRCIWSFRRFSAGLLSWQCTHHRGLIARRRQRLALFHLRDRSLRLAWGAFRQCLGRKAVQRRDRLRGEFLCYRNCASAALGVWQQACVRGVRAYLQWARATVFWKVFRNRGGLHALRRHAHRRRRRRETLRCALAENISARRRAACGEFLQVAMTSRADNNIDSDFPHRGTLSTVFARWRGSLNRRAVSAPWIVKHPTAYGAGVVGAHFSPVSVSHEADKVFSVRAPLLRAAPRTDIPPALRGPPPSKTSPYPPYPSRFYTMDPVVVPAAMSKMQPRLPCSNVVGVVDGRLTLTDPTDPTDVAAASESISDSADPKSALLRDLLLFIDEFKHLV